MPRKAKRWTIEESGVRVRIFQNGGRWWADVRTGDKRVRTSLKTAEKATAERNARALAVETAKQRLLGTKPETLTLAQVFAAYDEHKGRKFEGQWRKAIERRIAAFMAAWGAETRVAAISQTSVDRYCEDRRAAYRVKRSDPAAMLRDGALDPDFRWLRSVFRWAMKHKTPDGSRLLRENPLDECTWPHEKNPLRKRATTERFAATLEQAGAVDPRGRLAAMLVIARYTARRVNAICQLRASDLLFSRDRILAALTHSAEGVELADHAPHGAIRWAAESDKMGVLHVAPISLTVRQALDRYLAANPRVGDVPLFPADRDRDEPVSRSTATKWLLRAEALAGLPKLARGAWHPYRRLWATERASKSDVSVAAGGGWKSTKTLALYQGATGESVLDAILNETPVAGAPTEGTKEAQSPA